jgi:hypothetical protein
MSIPERRPPRRQANPRGRSGPPPPFLLTEIIHHVDEPDAKSERRCRRRCRARAGFRPPSHHRFLLGWIDACREARRAWAPCHHQQQQRGSFSSGGRGPERGGGGDGAVVVAATPPPKTVCHYRDGSPTEGSDRPASAVGAAGTIRRRTTATRNGERRRGRTTVLDKDRGDTAGRDRLVL